MATDDTSAARVARNDAIFREANDKIVSAADDIGVASSSLPVLCECADEGCTTIVTVERDDYERVRSKPTHFINAPGHEQAGGPHVRVVADNGGWFEVAKVGEAARIAAELEGERLLGTHREVNDG